MAGIVGMMSRDFIKLSIVAILIGCPLAWIATEKFLSGYAYRTALEWEVFVFASVIILVISLSMVIFQVVKAALANPVDSLRNE